MNGFKSALLILSTTVLLGCVQTPVAKPVRHSQLAVSSVWDIPTNFPQGSHFKLRPTFAKHSSLTTTQTERAYTMYADAIAKNLHNHGYQPALGEQSADFIVAFGLALAVDVNDNVLSDKFGITPGLQENNGLDKGSFLIFVENASTGQRVWRGAIQGFVQEGIDANKRADRLDYSMHMLLSQFHKAHQ